MPKAAAVTLGDFPLFGLAAVDSLHRRSISKARRLVMRILRKFQVLDQPEGQINLARSSSRLTHGRSCGTSKNAAIQPSSHSQRAVRRHARFCFLSRSETRFAYDADDGSPPPDGQYGDEVQRAWASLDAAGGTFHDDSGYVWALHFTCDVKKRSVVATILWSGRRLSESVKIYLNFIS